MNDFNYEVADSIYTRSLCLTEVVLLPPIVLRGRMENHVAALRWLDCNLLELQEKRKSVPGCFVLPLADFPFGIRLSSTGFVMGKLIFQTQPSHTDGRLHCRIFSNPYSLLA
ncbi:hypothetical protein AVEN_159883-1 [Araneus ventricosus]|uniref:Uncharacterized protein n=1 Tax=Araneus ventricosus TaxID=182803 RepID=A0A4Y2E236_ARAVE|nr:hypothetical protein AVEN_159883-1 [Araneus ventricosus]